MISRRLLLIFAAILAATVPSLPARAGDPPAGVIGKFYNTLLAAMKDGPKLGFKGRYDKLAPTVRQSFDLPLMTRLMVGPQWAGIPAEQQQQIVAAFAEFSIATYASRFDEFSGEKFEVDANPTPSNSGVIVRSKLVKSDGEPVQLDYLMRESAAGWQIVDVFLSGTVSELATRRSEFSSVMRRGGAEALVDALQKKVAQLRS
jgi:phospholipid transport system substrate-binding protein